MTPSELPHAHESVHGPLNKMKITVILCTYNRSQLLATALESVAVSTMPQSDEWEVLIVDNNSRDKTREVAQQFCDRYPGRFRYLFEAQQGKSFALNTGIHEAHGDVLAFMDDDVTVHPSWLQNVTAPLRDPQWAGVGGRIILQWPQTLPNWLTVEGPMARHAFPGFDQGDQPKPLSGPPFGTNMAYRKEVFEKHGGFRTDLGPTPGSEIRAEDTEFGRRVIAGGAHLCYEPTAIVYHPVPANRIDKKHLEKWWFDNGRSLAREFPIQPMRESASLAAWFLRWLVAVEPRTRFYRKLVVWEKAGKIKECYSK
jgi:glycosyltransferase involved in cell wall biosynthesis